MTEKDRNKRNSSRAKELYPTFRARILQVIRDLEAQGLRPRIQDAWRSPEAQLEAFKSGHSKLEYGFHNVTGSNGAKEALAVDLLDDDHPAKERTEYLLHLAAAAEANGLITGIRWDLEDKERKAIDSAISAKNWKAKVKVSWDPTHVQPTGITPGQARMGSRPN